MKSTLSQIVAEKTKIESILDFLPYPFLLSEWRDNTYHNVYFNTRFKEELGYAVAEIPTVEDWFRVAYPDPSYRQEVIALWNERSAEARSRGDDSVVVKVQIRTKHHRHQWFEVKSCTMGTFQMVAFVNIEEAIVRERALEKLIENKDRTLSILTHDLRTPIANFQALANLVVENAVTQEEFMRHVGMLQHRASQLLDVIDTTLLWTKANFENLQATITTVPVHDVVSEVTGFYQSYLDKKQLTLDSRVEEANFQSDPEIIRIVIRNLLTNAIKFTERGTITIEGKPKPSGYEVIVRDTGIGMPTSMLSSLHHVADFTSRPGTRHEKGLGIGLKLCFHLANLIGAKITFTSQENTGTSAVFTLTTTA